MYFKVCFKHLTKEICSQIEIQPLNYCSAGSDNILMVQCLKFSITTNLVMVGLLDPPMCSLS